MGCQRPKSNFQQVSNRRGPSQLSNSHCGFFLSWRHPVKVTTHFGSQWRCTIRHRRETLCFRAAALTVLFKEHNPFFPLLKSYSEAQQSQQGSQNALHENRIRGSGGSARPAGSHPMACRTESLSTASDNLNQGPAHFFSCKETDNMHFQLCRPCGLCCNCSTLLL